MGPKTDGELEDQVKGAIIQERRKGVGLDSVLRERRDSSKETCNRRFCRIPGQLGLICGIRLVTQAMPDYIRRVRDPYVDNQSSHRIPATEHPNPHCNLENPDQYNSPQTGRRVLHLLRPEPV